MERRRRGPGAPDSDDGIGQETWDEGRTSLADPGFGEEPTATGVPSPPAEPPVVTSSVLSPRPVLKQRPGGAANPGYTGRTPSDATAVEDPPSLAPPMKPEPKPDPRRTVEIPRGPSADDLPAPTPRPSAAQRLPSTPTRVIERPRRGFSGAARYVFKWAVAGAALGAMGLAALSWWGPRRSAPGPGAAPAPTAPGARVRPRVDGPSPESQLAVRTLDRAYQHYLEAAPRAEETGYLTVITDQPAAVFVDGVRLPKTTPILRHPVQPGERAIAVQSLRTRRRQQVTLSFEKGQTQKLERRFQDR